MSKLELIFDNDDARHAFYAAVLDCNILDGFEFNTDYDGSSPWDKGDYSKLRLEGSGDPEGYDYD